MGSTASTGVLLLAGSMKYTLLVFLLTAVLSTFASASLEGQRDKYASFRCQKPLASLAKENAGLKAKSLEAIKSNNCDFSYFSIQNASVSVLCEPSDEKIAESSVDTPADVTCRATVALDMNLSPEFSLLLQHQQQGSAVRQGDVDEHRDIWRYSLALFHTAEKGGVHYKGYQQNGYSVCCDLLRQPGSFSVSRNDPASFCTWRLADEAREFDQRVLSPDCPAPQVPLTNAEKKAREGSSQHFSGVITKPLPFYVGGEWLAKVQLWRTREGALDRAASKWEEEVEMVNEESSSKTMRFTEDEENVEWLGRVVIPFQVDEEDLALAKGRGASSGQSAVTATQETDL